MTTVDPTVTANADAWSGGTLVLRSASFTGRDSVPVVTVGAETLAVRSQGSDSALVQLPDTSGWIQLKIRISHGEAFAAVRVHGFTAGRPGPVMEASIYPWPGAGTATALGFQQGRLVLFDYRANTVCASLVPDTALDGLCGFGPLPSATVPGLVAVHQHLSDYACGAVLAVPVTPAAVPPDTGPLFYGFAPVLHLSRGTWLVTNDIHHWSIVTRTGPGTFSQTAQLAVDMPVGFAISAGGKRVFSAFSYAPGGVPILDGTTTSVAYTLPLRNTWTAAFSVGGDTLFSTGEDSLGADVLLSMDAASGAVFARSSIPGGFYGAGLAVAADPARPWLYVAASADGEPQVDVYDKATLAHVATLRAPPDLKSVGNAFYPPWAWAFVMSPVERQLYLTFNNAHASGPTYVFQYDLMP